MRDDLVDRIDALDWPTIERSLDAQGFAPLGAVLTAEQCAALTGMYGDDGRFRSRIDMARFRFGSGEYKYFANPLPETVQSLRSALYARLASTANRWTTAYGSAALKGPPYTRRAAPRDTGSAATPDSRRAATRDSGSAGLSGPRFPGALDEGRAAARDSGSAGLSGPRFPGALDDYLAICHAADQRRPTPLVLSYRAGDYNCLHQDIYGEVAFPLQVVFGLSRPGVDYQGGELLLVEQRPRAQSRGHAVAIPQGAGVVFATRERPVAGARGPYRVVMRHGVSTIKAGARMSLGIIFHDAK